MLNQCSAKVSYLLYSYSSPINYLAESMKISAEFWRNFANYKKLRTTASELCNLLLLLLLINP